MSYQVWLLLGLSFGLLGTGVYVMHTAERRPAKWKFPFFLLFAFLAQLVFGAAAWVAKKPEWLDPY